MKPTKNEFKTIVNQYFPYISEVYINYYYLIYDREDRFNQGIEHCVVAYILSKTLHNQNNQ